jgi:hypothetical protein
MIRFNDGMKDYSRDYPVLRRRDAKGAWEYRRMTAGEQAEWDDRKFW